MGVAKGAEFGEGVEERNKLSALKRDPSIEDVLYMIGGTPKHHRQLPEGPVCCLIQAGNRSL